MSVLRATNVYFSAHEPWKLRKTAAEVPEDASRLGTTLYTTLEALRVCGLLLQPAMPTAAASLLDHLGVPAAERGAAHFGYGRAPGAKLACEKKLVLFKKIAAPKA